MRNQVPSVRVTDVALPLGLNTCPKWIQDKKVMAVTPRPEFKPFFGLQYAGMSHYMLPVRPRGALGSKVQMAYLVEILCPQVKGITIMPRKLSAKPRAVERDH